MAAQFPLAVVISAVDRLTGPVGRMEGGLAKFGRRATRVGRNLTLSVTAPALLLGGATLKASGDFEAGMNRVRAISRASDSDLSKLRDSAKKLGIETRFSATQAADGYGFLAQAGFDVREQLAALPAVLDLAAGANQDLGETANATAKILRGYGLEAGQMTDLADKLTVVTGSATTDLRELAEGMVFAGPVASAMNQELSTTLAVMGGLADAGFTASLGGNALKNMLARLAVPAGAAKRALKDMGIRRSDLLDSEGNVRDLIEVLELLESKGASAGQIMTIFGLRAGPGTLKFVKQGSEGLRELKARLDGPDSAGAAALRAKIMMEGLNGSTLELKSAFEGLMIAIGDSGLLEDMTGFLKRLTGIVRGLSDTNPRILAIGVLALGLDAAVGPALIIIGQMSLGVSALSTVFTTALIPALKFLSVTIVRTVIPSIVSFGVALMTNPVGIVIVALGALIAIGVLVAKNWDKISEGLVYAWKRIKDGVASAIDWVLRKVAALVDAMPDWLVDLLSMTNPLAGAIIKSEAIESRRAGAAAAQPGVSAGAGAQSQAHVKVQFDNLPGNARVDRVGGDADLDLDVGMAMEGVGG